MQQEQIIISKLLFFTTLLRSDAEIRLHIRCDVTSDRTRISGENDKTRS